MADLEGTTDLALGKNGKKYRLPYQIFVLYLFNLLEIVFYVSVKTWVLVLYFSIYFAYLSKCLSEYFLSSIYLPGTRLVEHVFVHEACHNHEGVLLF